MKISNNAHLTYCTNIHPGASWAAVLESLQYTLAVKRQFTEQPFGIGLRLSAQAAEQLGTGPELEQFKAWLAKHHCYVFTMNGFPYGGFHGTVVKDQVHAPDWTTSERIAYTNLLFDQLAYLLPTELEEGGVSTSPISYRFWFETAEALEEAKREGARNLIKVVQHLVAIKERTGKSLHLDIEPEPDGILENSTEFLDFYNDILLPMGGKILRRELSCSLEEAQAKIREHIQLCYDVCHFAVEYESPEAVIATIQSHGIRIGKIQISAAIKTLLTSDAASLEDIARSLTPYNESTYLHQTVFHTTSGELVKYPDLGPALKSLDHADYTELRTHFHVPIFTDTYGALQSTQSEIVDVLKLWKAAPFSNHLEVETYTWDVLPDNNQLKLTDSIFRELDWVLQVLNS